MAIDTAPKRRSVAHVARRWSGAGITPNAAKPQFWRQCVARGYGGITTDAPVTPTPSAASGFVHPLTSSFCK